MGRKYNDKSILAIKSSDVTEPGSKTTFGRPKMMWKDTVKKDVEALGGKPKWKILALDRDN